MPLLDGAEKKEFYTAPEFAKLIGFHEQTLRYWDKTGKFKPHHRTPGGTRMYSLEQIKDLQAIYAANGMFNGLAELGARRKKPAAGMPCVPGARGASGQEEPCQEEGCGGQDGSGLSGDCPSE